MLILPLPKLAVLHNNPQFFNPQWVIMILYKTCICTIWCLPVTVAGAVSWVTGAVLNCPTQGLSMMNPSGSTKKTKKTKKVPTLILINKTS